MINNGLFSTLFIQSLKQNFSLDDAAKGRMATLAQTWKTWDDRSAEYLWNSFLKQALGNLEFVCPQDTFQPNTYLLYEDWGFTRDIAVLYLVEPGSDINDFSVGRFYPAKLLAVAQERKLNWGILTDGSVWRLYSLKSSRPFEDYVELDLSQTLESWDEQHYGLFERFFHLDSFVALQAEDDEQFAQQDIQAGIYKCRLDTDRELSEQILEKEVKNPFLRQVDEVLQYICNGFIFDTSKTGEEYSEEERQEIFQSAVKLIYRCLFLFYAEARSLLPSDPQKTELYQSHSIQALCLEARKFRWGKRQDTDQFDLWFHLKGLINAVNEGDPEYGIMGYNGGLFDDEEEIFLGRQKLRNDFLSRALYLLAFVEPQDNDQDREYPIPYKDLEVRHLGELYENILEYTVQLADADRIRRTTSKGTEIILASTTQRKPGDRLIKKGQVYFGESALERKQTGSYYTSESLVRFLNQKTIIQPLQEIFEAKHRQRFKELLDQAENAMDQGVRRGATQSAAALVQHFVQEDFLHFKVCDPAMGSGHFLVNAANQMAALVVSLLEEIPYVSGMQLSVTSLPNHWRRLVTRHCIYGVDINPLSMNLAKLSLWLNCFAIDHKLTFLDHHLRCGNSLMGIRNLNQLSRIPERKKDRKKESQKSQIFDYTSLSNALAEVSTDIASINQVHEDDTDTQKEMLDSAMRSMSRLRPLADLYTAYLMDSDIIAWEYKTLFEKLARDGSLKDSPNPNLSRIHGRVEYYRKQHSFFHWPLEFSDVFGPGAAGGFSATVGNPPWDIVKPSSQEFFSSYDPKFRSYKKQEAIKKAKALMEENKAVEDKWNEYREAIARQSAYFKEPESFQALGRGDINTFKLFLERFFSVLTTNGQMGIIVPSGLYTDQGCQNLREMFFRNSRIDFLYCFENRRAVFNIHRSFKFILFGAQKGQKSDEFKCAFMEHDPERLPLIDANALFLSLDNVKRFSGDALSLPEFNNTKSLEIGLKILGDNTLIGCANGIRVEDEVHKTNDSALFCSKDQDTWPVYQGGQIWFFDHNFSDVDLWVQNLDAETYAQKEIINASKNRRYLLCKPGNNFVPKRTWSDEPRLVFREIAASTNERTFIFAMIPPYSLHTYSLRSFERFYLTGKHPKSIEAKDVLSFQDLAIYLVVLNSFVVDFYMRAQCTNHLSTIYMYAPIAQSIFEDKIKKVLSCRAVRLTCISEDLDQFWQTVFCDEFKNPSFWYPPSAPIDTYGPVHEQEIRKRLRDEAPGLTPEWGPHCGVHDRLPDRRDTGDRAQLRAEIDAYVAHLYGLSRDDFAYILDTFPVLKRKEEKAFGEFMSKRKCLEEYDRIGIILATGESNDP